MRNITLTNDEKLFILKNAPKVNDISNSELLSISESIYFIISKIERIKNLYSILSNNNDSCISIMNLPCDDVFSGIEESVAIGLTKFLGEVFQYREQNSGRLNGKLTPKPDFLGKNNTGEGDGYFGWHTDDSVFSKDYRTDWIQLFCVNNDAKTITRYAKLDNIIENLTEEDVSILSEDRFLFAMPFSFNCKTKKVSEPKPVLTKINDIYEVSYSEYNCFPVDNNDKKAINAIKNICKVANKVADEIVLSKGQAFIFDNNRGIHNRDKINGSRILYRTYIKRDLKALNAIKSSIDNTFSYLDII